MKLSELEIEDLKRIRLAPDDVLLVRVKGHISVEAAKRVEEITARVLPGHKILVVEDAIELVAVSQEDARSQEDLYSAR